MRLDLLKLKQVLCAYATKSMDFYIQYLKEQVISMLINLESFMDSVEPKIGAISGEESDTSAVMQCMRLFNTIKMQQVEVDTKFGAMHRTVLLLNRLGHILPDDKNRFFMSCPRRWSILKKKVTLAKQKMRPCIQALYMSHSQHLEDFGQSCQQLHEDFSRCSAFVSGFVIEYTDKSIRDFDHKLKAIEYEAQASNRIYQAL